MKRIKFKLVKKVIICLSLGITFSGFSQIGIGTAEPSLQSSLDIRATDKGLLIPRLTTAQRTTLGTSLTTAANSNNKGMQVFDTDLNLNWFWNGTAWKKISAIPEWELSGVYETGDIVKSEGVLYEANGNVPTNTAFVTGTSGATWKLLGKTNLTAHNVTGSNLISGELVFIDPQYGVYENPAKALAGSASSFFNSEKRVGTLQGDVTLNIGVNQPFNFFDKGSAIIRGVSNFTDNTNAIRGFNQGEEVWYRPFESEKFSNNKGTLGNAIRLGYCTSNGGTSTALGINFDPVFVYKESEVASSYKPIINPNATLPGATRVGRSIVGTTGLSGVFVGKANNYVDYDGTNFTFTAPNSGERVILVDNVANIGQTYEFSGTAWNFLSKTTPLATDNYNVSRNYQQNDLVVRNNKIYQSNDYVAGGTAFAIGTTGATWKRISELPDWVLAAVYETGDVVKRDGTLYEANGNIAINTAFVIGTTGATWKALGSSAGTGDWISAGTVQAVGVGATTTAPTLPTTAFQNRVNYRRVGSKTYEVQAVLNYNSNVGGSNGNGDYLFTLPAGLQFDLSIPTQTGNQTNVGVNTINNLANGIPGSSFMLVSDNTAANNIVGVLPWDATRYRLIIWIPGQSISSWGSGNWQIMHNTNRWASWSFTFQTP